LTVYDEDGLGGNPPRLFVGGDFTVVNGVAANRIARWDGTSFSSLGSGVDATVNTLATYDPDGAGTTPASLIVAGAFTLANGASASRIARWNGASWSALGQGCNATIRKVLEFDNDGPSGNPAALIVCGDFTLAGGSSANRVARWNGTVWQSLGTGANAVARSVAQVDHDGNDATPDVVAVGGDFTSMGGVNANRIAFWNGSVWTSAGSGANQSVSFLSAFDGDTTGPQPETMLASGGFTAIGGLSTRRLGTWSAGTWRSWGHGLWNYPETMSVLDLDGAGPGGEELIVGGNVWTAGGIGGSGIMAWNGNQWRIVGNSLPGYQGSSGTVRSIALFDEDGPGPVASKMFVAGSLGNPFNGRARLNGTTWESVAGGFSGSNFPQGYALAVYDRDESGPHLPELYFGGQGTYFVGGQTVNNVARWDGLTWSDVGGGIQASAGLFATAYAMAVFDPDDSGPIPPSLFVGGYFTSAGNTVNTANIARWDGSQWHSVGGADSSVDCFFVRQEADGPRLYAGGDFQSIGGVFSPHIAVWDGKGWSALGGGLPQYVFSITDLGSADIYVAGGWEYPWNEPIGRVAKWDGENWSLFGSLPGWNCTQQQSFVYSILGVQNQALFGGTSLVIGGQFMFAEDEAATNLAVHRFVEPQIGDVNGDGTVDVDDLIAVILAWGNCPTPPATCPADVNQSGAVDVDDLIAVILNWG
jgi:hypothetical protein